MKALRHRTLWNAIGWGIIVAIIWLSVRTNPFAMDVPGSDKVEHGFAYATLMFWFCQLHPGKARQCAYAVAWIALGIALEFVQRQVGRDFEVLDMAADAVGVLIGWGLGALPGVRLLERLEAAFQVTGTAGKRPRA